MTVATCLATNLQLNRWASEYALKHVESSMGVRIACPNTVFRKSFVNNRLCLSEKNLHVSCEDGPKLMRSPNEHVWRALLARASDIAGKAGHF